MLWQTVDAAVFRVQPLGAALTALAGLTWLACLLAYGLRLRAHPPALMDDFRHPVQGAFLPLIGITGMVLGALLYRWLPQAGWWLTVVSAALSLMLGLLVMARWLRVRPALASLHPAWYLPGVAAGFVGSGSLAQVGLPDVAHAFFGLGLVCWTVIGPLLVHRLMRGPALPEPLVPLQAILIAPPVVAGIAWSVMHPADHGAMPLTLTLIALLMAVVQAIQFGRFRSVGFVPACWAYVFSYSATAAWLVRWLAPARHPAALGVVVLLLVAMTALVGWAALRTVQQIREGRYFPRMP